MHLLYEAMMTIDEKETACQYPNYSLLDRLFYFYAN